MSKTIPAFCLFLAVVFGLAAAGSAASGEELYAKCRGCHGPDASKQIPSKAEGDIVKALKGYRDKTFGGEKKAIMERLAKDLSDEDIQALAKYISTL